MSAWALHGSAAPALVVAGHSHTLCQLQALHAAPREWAAVAYTTALADGPPLADDYWDFVGALDPAIDVAVVWNGNQHHAQFLIDQVPPIAVWDDARERVSAAGRLLPRTQFRALWEPTVQPLIDVLPALSQSRRTVIVGTPPPKASALVRANLSTEKWFEPTATALGLELADLPITAEMTRLALWRLLQGRLCEIAADAGVSFLPAPELAATADGFLHAELSSPDATHANAAYGDLVWGVLDAWRQQP